MALIAFVEVYAVMLHQRSYFYYIYDRTFTTSTIVLLGSIAKINVIKDVSLPLDQQSERNSLMVLLKKRVLFLLRSGII